MTEDDVIEGTFEDVTEEQQERHLPAVVDRDMTPIYDLGTMSDADFEERIGTLTRGVTRIAQLQRSLLTEGTDWGSVPGVPKPFLFKPGAEKIALFYHLVPEFRPDVRIERPEGATVDRITVITRCLLHLQSQDGPVVGDGTGAASSWEDRYRWRQGERTCPQCGKPAIIKGKAEYGGGWVCFKKKDGCGAKWPDGAAAIEGQNTARVENDAPHDQLNTLVKMSAKRSMVDAVIRATGASGIFTQDDEDVVKPRPGQGDSGGDGDWQGGWDDSEATASAPTRAADGRGASPAVSSDHKKGDEWQDGDPARFAGKVDKVPDGLRRTEDGRQVLELAIKVGNSKHTIYALDNAAAWALSLVTAEGQRVAVDGTRFLFKWDDAKPPMKRIRDVTKLMIDVNGTWQAYPAGGASASPPPNGTAPSPSATTSSSTPSDAATPTTPAPEPAGPTSSTATTPSKVESSATSPKDEPTSSTSGDDATASPSDHGTTTTSAGEIFDLARAVGTAGEEVDASGTILTQAFAQTGSGTPFYALRIAGEDGYEYHFAVPTGAYDMVLAPGDDPRSPKWKDGTRVRCRGAWNGSGKVAVLTMAMLR